MGMGKLLLGLAASVAFVAPANATVVLFDTFDGEAGGQDSLNHNAFANFDVENGTVDVIHNPNPYAITCLSGSCVDLDGSTFDGGRIVTKNAYTFHAGNTVTLELQLSGSQVGLTFPEFIGSDGFFMGFRTAGAPIQFNNITFDSQFLGSESGGSATGTSVNSFDVVNHDLPFGFVRLSFTAGNAGSLKAFAGTTSADNVGPIIDNFSLSIAGVPEPATWGMMILGFGFAGGAMRVRKRSLRFATATA
jgi:PEP-CTERM motif